MNLVYVHGLVWKWEATTQDGLVNPYYFNFTEDLKRLLYRMSFLLQQIRNQQFLTFQSIYYSTHVILYNTVYYLISEKSSLTWAHFSYVCRRMIVTSKTVDLDLALSKGSQNVSNRLRVKIMNYKLTYYLTGTVWIDLPVLSSFKCELSTSCDTEMCLLQSS